MALNEWVNIYEKQLFNAFQHETDGYWNKHTFHKANLFFFIKTKNIVAKYPYCLTISYKSFDMYSC